jgi:aminoglycoside 3-N-acetyltransferase I
MDTTIIKLDAADARLLSDLLDVYEEAFGLTEYIRPPSGYLDQLLHHPMVTFLVAQYEDRVIGGLTAYTLPSVYFPASEVYLYDLAIQPAFQRRGIGIRLLDELKAHCIQANIREIFVQADLPDKHAIDFYLRNGGIPENVIHFSFPCTQPGELPAFTR